MPFPRRGSTFNVNALWPKEEGDCISVEINDLRSKERIKFKEYLNLLKKPQIPALTLLRCNGKVLSCHL